MRKGDFMAKAALNVVLVTALLIVLLIGGMYLDLSWQVCAGAALIAAIVGVGIRLIVRRRYLAKYPIGVETRFTPADATANEAEPLELGRRPQAELLESLPASVDGAEAGGKGGSSIPAFLRSRTIDPNKPPHVKPPDFFVRFEQPNSAEGNPAPVGAIPPESPQPLAGNEEPAGTVNGSGRRIRGERGGVRHHQPGGSTPAHVRGQPHGKRQ